MKIRVLYIIVFSCLTFFCTDHENLFDRPYPALQTNSVTNITSSGAKFQGRVVDLNGNKVIDHGFLWGTDPQLNLEGDNKKSLGELNDAQEFSADIFTTLEVGKDYYVKAYLKTEKLTVYGNVVSFLSLGSKAPLITDFNPKTGSTFDTISIRGQGFSFVKKNNEVKFNDIKAEITDFSDTLLRAIVPGTLESSKSKISVSVVGNTVQASEDFTLLPAEIFSVSQSVVRACDTLIIEGKNFPRSPAGAKVYLNGTHCEIISIATNEIQIRVPGFLPPTESVSLKIVSSNIETIFRDNLTYKKPEVVGISTRTNTTFGDTLKISGKNLPVCGGITLKIGTITPTIVDQSDSIIAFIIPETLTQTTNTATLTYVGTPLSFNKTFALSLPTIFSASPATGTFGDLITINGKNFHPKKERNSLTLAGINSEILSAEPTKLIVKVAPNSSGTCEICKIIYVNVDNRSANILNAFTLKAPVINSIDKSLFEEPDLLTIHGQNFNPQPSLNHVLFGSGTKLEIVSATTEEIVVKISLSALSNGDPLTTSVNNTSVWVKTGNQDSNHEPITFDYKGPWTKLDGLPTGIRSNYISFTVNNKFYVGLGNSGNTLLKDIWELDPASSTWTKKSDFPGSDMRQAFSFSCNGKGYIGMGISPTGWPTADVWQYDPTSDTWTQLNDFPGQPRSSAESFSINNYGYLMGGSTTAYNKEVWKYDPTNDTWQQLSTAPIAISSPNSFVLNGKAYILNHSFSASGSYQSKLYEYTPETETWLFKVDLPAHAYPIVFPKNTAISGGYIIDFVGVLSKYDPDSNSLKKLTSKVSYREAMSSGEINGKQYIFGGFYNSGHPRFEITFYNELWEFDYTHYPPGF